MSEIDLVDLRKQCIASLFLCTDNISKYVETDKKVEFNKLKSYVEGYCLLEAQEEVAIQALERAKRETDSTNEDTLEARFQAHLSSLAKKKLNVKTHPYMTELNTRIAKGLSNNLQSDDDIAITQSQEQQYIDPITKRPIVEPVRNSLCGHIYDRESIMNLISMNNRTKCPVAGCGNNDIVQKEHLINDDELRFRLAITQNSTMIEERSIVNVNNDTTLFEL